jgi:hypothetical protein
VRMVEVGEILGGGIGSFDGSDGMCGGCFAMEFSFGGTVSIYTQSNIGSDASSIFISPLDSEEVVE